MQTGADEQYGDRECGEVLIALGLWTSEAVGLARASVEWGYKFHSGVTQPGIDFTAGAQREGVEDLTTHLP